VLKINKP